MSDNVTLSEDRYHGLIYGYSRQSAVSFKLEMPLEIIDIINLFYPKLDRFDTKLSHTDLEIG